MNIQFKVVFVNFYLFFYKYLNYYLLCSIVFGVPGLVLYHVLSAFSGLGSKLVHCHIASEPLVSRKQVTKTEVCCCLYIGCGTGCQTSMVPQALRHHIDYSMLQHGVQQQPLIAVRNRRLELYYSTMYNGLLQPFI